MRTKNHLDRAVDGEAYRASLPRLRAQNPFRGEVMALSRAQVDNFCEDLAELFSIPPPNISRRRRVRCRWKQCTLHLGRNIRRDELAHALAHYIQRELNWPDGMHKRRFGADIPLRPRLHGSTFKAWAALIGNYVAQEFGEGEGVIL
jgi:hypothetical protein